MDRAAFVLSPAFSLATLGVTRADYVTGLASTDMSLKCPMMSSVFTTVILLWEDMMSAGQL